MIVSNILILLSNAIQCLSHPPIIKIHVLPSFSLASIRVRYSCFPPLFNLRKEKLASPGQFRHQQVLISQTIPFQFWLHRHSINAKKYFSFNLGSRTLCRVPQATQSVLGSLHFQLIRSSSLGATHADSNVDNAQAHMKI